MQKRRLQTHVGLLVLAFHFLAISLSVWLYMSGLFLFSEMTTIVALVTPLFATYSAAILRHFVEHQYSMASGRRVSGTYALLSYSLPTLLGAITVGAIALKALTGSFASFEEFKNILGIVEGCFGIYAGVLLKDLFRMS